MKHDTTLRTVFLVWDGSGRLMVATRSWWAASWVQRSTGGVMEAQRLTDEAQDLLMAIAVY